MRRVRISGTDNCDIHSTVVATTQTDEIAKKIGLDRIYIHGIVRLVEHGEELLIRAVEAGRMPTAGRR